MGLNSCRSTFKNAPHTIPFPTVWSFSFYNVHHSRFMISSTTPYKLAEIIRDTWPGLYRKPEPFYNKEKEINDERILGSNKQ